MASSPFAFITILTTDTVNKTTSDEIAIGASNPCTASQNTSSMVNNNLLEQALALYSTHFSSLDKYGCIGDYCAVKSGFAFKSSWWTNSGVKVIKISSINQDSLNLLECSYVDEDKADKATDSSGWKFYVVFLYSDGTVRIGSGADDRYNDYSDSTFESHANWWKSAVSSNIEAAMGL